MKVQTQAQGLTTVLVPHGPLIVGECADFRGAYDAATAAKARRVVVDMADVPYLDSAGLELLLELGGPQVPLQRRPKFAALSETCLEAMELTDVLPRLDVFDTVENALRSCQQ